ADQHALKFRDRSEELRVLLLRAKSHHPLDAGAVVPASIKENDFTARRQMRDVALEVPLGAFAFVRRRECGDPAYSRVETLRDPLDDAALAGGIAAFEDDDYLHLVMEHPVLQLDELALEAEQLLEVEVAVERFPFRIVRHLSQERVETVVVELHLQLFVKAVGHFRRNTGPQRITIEFVRFAHNDYSRRRFGSVAGTLACFSLQLCDTGGASLQ